VPAIGTLLWVLGILELVQPILIGFGLVPREAKRKGRR
jgi:hypothetical protein